MNFFLAFRNNTMLALDTIRTHKTRSMLTMLGVVIGTGTIIGVGAILTGFDGAVTGAAEELWPEFGDCVSHAGLSDFGFNSRTARPQAAQL